MIKKVIDVSTFQGTINWEKVKPQIDGAIIRCGYGSDILSQDDVQYGRNALECERLGIPYGVYLYSYADTEAKAESEAQHILRLIKGRKLTYPVYLDCEEEKPAIKAFAPRACEIIGKIITDAGYKFGVYANLNWWNNYLVTVDGYTKWVAQYNKTCDYKKPYDMWQYTSKGSIDGIKGNVDMNECYKDFVSTQPNATSKKSIDELAQEVLDNKWGVNPERRERLIAAGYDAEAVQAKVNKLYRIKKESEPISIGSYVYLKEGAKTYDGKELSSFVYKRPHVVSQINGDRVVISYDKVVVAAVHLSDLKKA